MCCKRIAMVAVKWAVENISRSKETGRQLWQKSPDERENVENRYYMGWREC